MYIPAYWWYTFKFNENTSISCFKYRTYMNNIAISPKICMYALQNQNVEHKIAKQIDIKELNVKKINVTKINNEEIPEILIPKEEANSMDVIPNDTESLLYCPT